MILLFNRLIDMLHRLRSSRVDVIDPPWITYNIRDMQGLCDGALRKYRKTKDLVRWNYYEQLRNLTIIAIRGEKRA